MNRPRPLFGVLLAGSLLWPGLAVAQNDSGHIQRILSAAKTTSFAGIRTVTVRGRDGKVTSFNERVLKSGDKWQISYPDDSPFAGQRVYEIGRERFTYNAALNEIRVSPSRNQEELEGLKRWLEPGSDRREVSRFSPGRIAGREAIGLRLKMREGPVMEVCFDREKGSILKWSTIDSKGAVLGGFVYGSISFEVRISPQEFALPKGAKLVRLSDELRRVAQGLGMKAYTLSESSGFMLLSVSKFEHHGKVGYRQFLSAGDRKVSLFVLKGSTDFGRTPDRMNLYKWERDGSTFVLVGSMPPDELRRLSQAVRP